MRGTVGIPGPQAPPLSGPPSERRLHRPAPHVRPRPVQRSERGGRGVSAETERASGAGTPRAAGASAAPASPPSPPALGTAGRRRLPGRWRCTSRSVRCAPRGPRSAVPGTRRDAGIWRLRAEGGGGGRGAADERPGDPREGAVGGGAEARLGARPSWEVRMPRTRAKGGFGGARAGGSPARSDQPSRRGSVVRQRTVGTELERGPGFAGGAG